MAKLSKRARLVREKVDVLKDYEINEALTLLKELATAKFKESVDVAINLGIDARKSDQNVRGATVLPNGTGRDVRVAVFTQGANADKAKEAGITLLENHKLKVFSYLLDFSNSAANSSNTYGMELTGSSESCIGDLQYIFTAAVQKDAANNPVDYQAYYLRGQVAVKRDAYHFGLGSEMMTSDGSGRFLFPLGTNHKFNGFADAFLTTPTNGLIDTYAWIGTETYGINHKLSLHNYQSEELSSSIGWELDYVASKQLCKSSKGILKLAHLMGDNSQADITRASIEINYSF